MTKSRPSRVTWHLAHGVKTYKPELVEAVKSSPAYRRLQRKIEAKREAHYRQTEAALTVAFANREAW